MDGKARWSRVRKDKPTRGLKQMILFPTRKEVANEPEFHDWVEEITEQLKDADHIILKRVPSDPKDYKRLKKELRKANWDLNGTRLEPITPCNRGRALKVAAIAIIGVVILVATPLPEMVKILIGCFILGAVVPPAEDRDVDFY